MANIDKKRVKLQERIDTLEEELRSALGKKTHDTAEINVPAHMTKINQAKEQLRLHLSFKN